MFRRRRRSKGNEASASHMEGNVSPRTIERWSKSVPDTLKSPRGKRRFLNFLTNSNQRELLDTITFREKFAELLKLPDAEKLKAAKELAGRVEDGDLQVNLDEGMLARIYAATPPSKLYDIFEEFKKRFFIDNQIMQKAFADFVAQLKESRK